MVNRVAWRGTQTEAAELLAALNRHCSCLDDAGVQPFALCTAHRLLEDQRSLDRLLFARRIAARLRAEEHSPEVSGSVARS